MATAILFLVSCGESPRDCDREFRLNGPEYCSLYIYKFKDGKDYSDNVIVISPLREWDSSAYYITGYEPIKLHGGYYLGGNIPKLHNPQAEIHYLTLTYSDIENGNVPDNWIDHWWDYRIMPEECIHEWFYYRGRCSCDDAQCNYRNSPFYNPGITLHMPVEDDIHTDTALINKMIDGDSLSGFYNWQSPWYCDDCD